MKIIELKDTVIEKFKTLLFDHCCRVKLIKTRINKLEDPATKFI
jgi:hypothetical protein